MKHPNLPEDGGAAFPCEGGDNSGLLPDAGMSLRDYFAAAALKTMHSDVVRVYHAWLFDGKTEASEDRKWCAKIVKDLAATAYLVADAMIEARD